MQDCNKPCSYLKMSQAIKKKKKGEYKEGGTKENQREFNF